jgi:hypothetical protein
MASLFGTGSAADQPTRDTALRIQSSLQGKPLPILWGQTRIAGNLVWENDFVAVPQSGNTGGKGGFFAQSGSSTGYDYLVNVAIAICEGRIAGILQAWKDQTAQSLASLNLTAFVGSYVQTPWGLVSSLHPDQALGYRGVAYVAAGPMQLGGTSSLPNLNYEVKAAIADAIGGLPDADPATVVTDFLTNANYGLSPTFPVGDLTIYSNYCRAMGLVVSPAITSRAAANSFLRDLLDATNSEAVWSNGALKIVPYGDQDISANAASYTAPFEPEYDLSEDDFLPNQATEGPVVGVRKRQSDSINQVSVECLDRSNNYNPAIVEAKDDAAINDFGLRAGGTKSLHLFCSLTPARTSAALMLGREQIKNTYTFTLGEEFILLEPMDIVSLTDVDAGLSRQWVRILEIQENADYSLTFTVEEYLFGTGHAPHYGQQANTGHVRDFNEAPGSVNTPVILEPTGAMVPGPEVWIAVSGANGSVWGGCEVWASWDDVSYSKAGTRTGPAITGTLAQTLATVPVATSGQTVDQTNTCHVDLSTSGGELISSTLDAALMLDQLCFVDGEFISFQTATLEGTDRYALNYLVRGAFDTESRIVSHASGQPFARIDDKIFRFPYTPDKVGATLHLKFLSFNLWGGGTEQLADVGAYTHVIGGTWQQGALGSTVANFDAHAIDLNGAGGLVQPGILCTWSPVSDKTVKAVRVRYNIKNDSAYHEITFAPGPGVGTIPNLQASTIYQVQATIDVTPSRTTTFTSPVKEVTTNANQVVRTSARTQTIDGTEFASQLAATIALVQPTHLLALNTDILANSTASTVSTLQQTVTNNFNTLNAAVVNEAALRVSADSATASQLNTLSASLTNGFSSVDASIISLNQAMVDGDNANATSITNLTTTVDGHTSTLQVYGQSIDGLNSEFGVTIAFDNVIGGFKLTGVKQNADGSPRIAFLLDGDFITNGTITGPKVAADTIEGVHIKTHTLKADHAEGDSFVYNRAYTFTGTYQHPLANTPGGTSLSTTVISRTITLTKGVGVQLAGIASVSLTGSNNPDGSPGTSVVAWLTLNGNPLKQIFSSTYGGGQGPTSSADVTRVVPAIAPGDYTLGIRVDTHFPQFTGGSVTTVTVNEASIVVFEPRLPTA